MSLEFSHDGPKSTAKDGEAVIAELLRNGHLTAAEIKLFRERYAADRQKIIDESRNGLRGFVNSDIRQANEDYLSRPENTTKIRDIHDLQVALNTWLKQVNQNPISEDGSFGPETFRALIDFQKEHGLATDGVAGPITLALLDKDNTPTPTEPTPTEPTPTEPTPTEPTPTEPTPTEPIPTEPTPTEPIPTEPTPTEPTPTEPIPTEPIPTEPIPTEIPDQQDEEFNKMIETLEPLITTLKEKDAYLQQGNEIDDPNRVEDANKALQGLLSSEAYKKIKVQSGVEQDFPDIDQIQLHIDRAKQKYQLGIAARQAISGKDIEWEDSEWINLDGEGTTIEFNENWTAFDIVAFRANDSSLQGLKIKDAYEILLANKTFLQGSSPRYAGVERQKDDRKEPEKMTDMKESIEQVNSWKKERETATYLRDQFDNHGGDYASTSQLSHGYPNNLGYAPFLEGMMKNFDEGGNEELAKQGVKKTHANLSELEKRIGYLEINMVQEEKKSGTDTTAYRQMKELHDDIVHIYQEDLKTLATVTANLGNDWEENDNFINPEVAQEVGQKIIEHGTIKEGLDYLTTVHLRIHGNDLQSEKEKEVYKRITKTLAQSLLAKISSDPTLSKEKKAECQIFIAKLITDRDWQYNIDNETKDPELAIDILEQTIDMPAAALQIREKSEGPSPIRRKIKEEHPSQIITEADAVKTPEGTPLITDKQREILSRDNPQDGLKELSEQYALIQFVKAAIFNAKQTDPRNFKTVSSSDIQKDIGGMMNGYMDVAIKGMYDKLSTGAFGKTVGEFEDLSGITLSPRQKEAYALLADMKGLGWMDMSDANAAIAESVGKVAGLVVLGIVAAIATAPAGGSGGWAFLAAAAGAGATMTAGEALIFNKSMNAEEMAVSWAVNTAGFATGMGFARALGTGAKAGTLMARLQSLKAVNALRALQAGGRVAQGVGVGIEGGINLVSGATFNALGASVLKGKSFGQAFEEGLTDPLSLVMSLFPMIGVLRGSKSALQHEYTREGWSLMEDIAKSKGKNIKEMHESDIIDLVHDMMEGDIADPVLQKRVQAYREKIKSLKPDTPEEKPNTTSEDTENLSVLEQKKEAARKLQEKEPLTDTEKETLAKLVKEIDELQGLPINTHNGSLDISQTEISTLDDFIKLAKTVADENGIVRFSDGKQMHIDDLKLALEQAMETGDTSYLTRSGGIREKLTKIVEANKVETYDGKSFKDLDALREYLKTKGKIKLSDGSERSADEILRDIDEIRAGREKINVVTKEGGLRSLVQKLLRPEENEAIFNKLWPQGLEYGNMQGQVGNCYFLAAMNAIKRLPDAKNILGRMIRELKPGQEWQVIMPGDSRIMRITKADIVKAQKQGLISHGPNGDVIYGDQILEYAYHRLRREQVDGIQSGDASGRTVMRRGNDNVIASDGGWPEDALRHMLGNGFDTGQVRINNIDSLLKKDGTMISLISKLENNDTHTYSCKDLNNKNIDVHYAHAYSVKGVTTVDGKIVFEIVNPHDSARSFKMTLEQVKQYFERASYAQPKNNKARRAAFTTSAALTQ